MPRSAAATLVCLALGPLMGGCVHMYQPLGGLNHPVVVDPQEPNLLGTRITVVCNPTDTLKPAEATSLCEQVGTLFEIQGAVVRTQVGGGRASAGSNQVGQADADPVFPHDLTVEITGRELSRSRHPLTWALAAATFTLVPAITESVFQQEVVVRDSAGTPLASQLLTGRLTRSVGAATWAGNRLLDLLVRDAAGQVTRDAANKALSADLYGQLSQAVFNARQQLRVSGPTPPRGAE